MAAQSINKVSAATNKLSTALPIKRVSATGTQHHSAYQARFASVTVDGSGAPTVTLDEIPSTGNDKDWISKLLMFCSGAPLVVNQYLDLSTSSQNVGDFLYIKNSLSEGSYTQIPASTRQTMFTPVTGTDAGWILRGPVATAYQQPASGTTVTNNAPVSGYFIQSMPLQREVIYYRSAYGEFIQATGGLMIEVIGKGAATGPSLFFNNGFSTVPPATVPIVVNETTFGLYNLNTDYTFGSGGITYVVVGLWAKQAPTDSSSR